MGEGNVTLKLVSAYLQVSPYLRKTQTWSPRSLGKLGRRRAQCSEPRKQQWTLRVRSRFQAGSVPRQIQCKWWCAFNATGDQ
ncbi:hypothetical protein V1478_011427 [Vespula squamosa]|uniref:Uncharacterized protein n=1 Tax=Vespula squamosa TaxID=30214 RepID=A0ABD2AEH1_VESSQ